MYWGLLLALTGCAIYLANALAFLFLPVFVACISRLQIVPEERALAAKFGDAFAAYKRSVRRWL
jgi:protein-S-isoprenylcysteine O-methyltransferase Ste14